MNKLRLIIAREYMSIVGRKSFIILTLLFPFLMIGLGSIPVLMAYLNDKGEEAQRIAVCDETGRYATALPNDDKFNFLLIEGATVTDANEFFSEKDNDSYYNALVVIPREVDSTGVVNIYSKGNIIPALESTVKSALTDTIESAHLAAMGIPNLQEIMDKAHVNIDVRAIKLSETGDAKESSTDIAIALGMVLSLVIFWFVFFSGTMIMNNVVEEKTNRIVGLSVLTQMGIWIVLLGIAGVIGGSLMGVSSTVASPEMIGAGAAAAPEIESEMGGFLRQLMSINFTSIIINFLLYFVEGYLLYCAIFAALGSAVDQASDTSQLLTPVMLLMFFAFYAAIGCAQNPDGPMAFWCSIIPFTSPTVMMVRLPFEVPIWQIILSHVLLIATALAIVWLAGRIYRRGILSYGKKASFKDLFNWLK